jgi:hypothetical protein
MDDVLAEVVLYNEKASLLSMSGRDYKQSIGAQHAGGCTSFAQPFKLI